MKKIPCEVWSRVVGYFRPTKEWNKGKQAEFKDRKDLIPKGGLNAISKEVERK